MTHATGLNLLNIESGIEGKHSQISTRVNVLKLDSSVSQVEWPMPRPHDLNKAMNIHMAEVPHASLCIGTQSYAGSSSEHVNNVVSPGPGTRLATPYEGVFDTLYTNATAPAKSLNIGQAGASVSRYRRNQVGTLVPKQRLQPTSPTPLRGETDFVIKVNMSRGGHAISTPHAGRPDKRVKKTLTLLNDTDIRDLSMIRMTDEDVSFENFIDLNDTVDEILNKSVQDALPVGHHCGPTPYQFREYLDSAWPVISGEKWGDFKQYADIYTRVRHTALPNFLAARVTIPSTLNIENWRQALIDYPDKTLVDQLQFGFPSNYTKNVIPVPSYVNHKETCNYSDHITKYIQKECELGALLGPFRVPPFTPWSNCSPMMTREKSTPGQRRVIVDLSFPHGRSVNSGIPRKEFLGEPQVYSLPTVSMVGDKLRRLGAGCHIWTADISRAYRQLRADPLAAPLFGTTLNNMFYVDIALPFGCRSSGASCVRVTSSILWILQKKGFNGFVYVDDFLGVEASYLQAMMAFDTFIQICSFLGIQLARDKCHPPSVQVVWLGFYIDAGAMTIAIPATKLDLVLKDAASWLSRPRATKKALQQLVGRLVHLCSCVQHGRRFISRILAALSRAYYVPMVEVDLDLIRDVQWFLQYAKLSNGITLLPPAYPHEWIIECDSCMTGGGAFSKTHYFTEKYSTAFTTRFGTIHALEAVNLVEAVTHLAPADASGYLIRVNTDNKASASVLQSGKGADPDLTLCSRQLWLLAAIGSFNIQVDHKPGKDLILADALSRAHESPKSAALAAQQCARLNLRRVRMKHSESRFSCNL